MAGGDGTAQRRAGGRPSALMAQYARIKAQHRDAILLFRLGDFYEMFFEDAHTAARVLDLALTARNRGDPDEVPLCGFPAHAAQPYVARLLAAGHTVAVCEQAEARGRGLLAREVVRVITPGTILEEESLEPGAPSLLAALAAEGERFGLATIDFATGAVRATAVEGWPAAREELERLAPREVLLDADLPAEVAAACRAGRAWATAALPAPAAVAEALPRVAGRAAGGALAYVEATYRSRPAHLRAVEPYELAGVLRLDAATRRNLELFETLRGERRGSLLGVLDETTTPMGARRLREWLLYPLLDAAAIGARLDAVEELVDAVELRAALAPALARVGDLARLAGRVGARTASPRDLAALVDAFEGTGAAQNLLAGARATQLRDLGAALDPLPEVGQAIRATLVDAPAAHTRVPGFIRPGRHPEVDELRAIARDGKSWLARFEAAERQRTGIASLKVRYNRVFGYYIEVTRPNLPLVPADYERKQTLVGAERFVTPALKDYEAKVLGAEERLRVLEGHLFDELLEQVAMRQPTLARTADALATLDTLAALAAVAHRRGWIRPTLTQAPTLRIRGGRHPVVEALADTPFVPNDTTLAADGPQVLILTGPNMGGKSTYLRQVALIVLLAQVGAFVPAAEAEVGLVDRIFTRVGASDNLAAGESTFMVEMRETAAILGDLSPRSLVILDEIGRGTSTFDGISIAWAVAERLHDAPERPRTLFATHYHELTALAETRARVVNLCVAVAEWKGDIVFLRQIAPGPASRSYGVEVARLAGVPAPVVGRARELLAALEAGHAPGSPPAGRREAQLTLFTEPAERLRRELAALEPERLTPLEALGVLARLVEAARRPA
ncbi:MAG TPA: DNA mismatch repair protein MutS [Candidatus Binatia bacterium]|nr:DNA mismatch repair protein MutS [Candidatus Binatia bacterium]